ncbi:hypothetical protein HID58_054150 [Brassica napus]|uniref:Uncharacterized protein n=1 Tax=Brassica napus TaxID=3708 RepID=A0ABQ8AGT1_BRANA|nr:hypothetical protein HID58_054150 [Brassica napus]
MHYVCEGGKLFPFIYATGNNDVVDSTEYYREDEKKDERVGHIVTLLNAKQDWTEFVWEVEALPPTLELSDSEKDGENVEVEDVTNTHVEEPAVVARRGKRKLNDPGAEARKKELLCQRADEHNSGISSGMKTFIEGLFTSAFNSSRRWCRMTFKSVLRRSRKRWLSSSKRCYRFWVLLIQWEKTAHLTFLVLQQQWGNHHRVCVLQQQRKKAKARLRRVWFLLRFVVALGKEER